MKKNPGRKERREAARRNKAVVSKEKQKFNDIKNKHLGGK